MPLFDRETDPALERDGVPLDFGDYRVTLRRQGGANDRYALELEKLMKPHRAAANAGVLPQAKVDEIVFRSFARSCVARWETLNSSLPGYDKERDGEPKFVDGIDMRGKLEPCTEDNLVAVFTAIQGVFLDLREAARGEALFRLRRQEDDAGN